MSVSFNITDKPFVNKFCPTSNDVPDGTHYAIVEFATIFIPDVVINGEDFRNKGREQAVSYYFAFSMRDEWEKDAQRRILSKTGNPFIAIIANKTQLKVVVDDGVNHGKRF